MDAWSRATMSEHVTQADVAARAGVAQSTVARVLTGKCKSRGLELRVLDAIEELGYVKREGGPGRPRKEE